MEWEYFTAKWQFYGPEVDDWPRLDEYCDLLEKQVADEAAEEERQRSGRYLATMMEPSSSRILERDYLKGPAGDAMVDEYLEWRDLAELGALQQFGRIGFELVSVSRREQSEIVRHDHTVRLRVSEVEVFCYFKRPVAPGLEPPPIVGFQPPTDRPTGRARGHTVDASNRQA